MREKMAQLYRDWYKSQPTAVKYEADTYIMESNKSPLSFNKLSQIMGADGALFKQYFSESKFSADPIKAKKLAAAYLMSEDWEALGGNSIVSNNEITDNGIPAEIVTAIVSGQMDLAAALTQSMWNKLTPGDLNGIMRLANIHGKYNTGVVPKETGKTQFYTVDKKSDTTPNAWQAKAFPFSDPKNTKIYGDK
jgi:hypothetical protein